MFHHNRVQNQKTNHSISSRTSINVISNSNLFEADDTIKHTRTLKNSLRGWLPKESSIAYLHEPHKSHWKRSALIVAVVVLVITVGFFITLTLFSSEVAAFIRRVDPQTDLTSFGFHKESNMTTPVIGDTCKVNVTVRWLGQGNPPFERRVEIMDPYPENNYRIISGNNTIQYTSYGGEAQITYILEVIDDNPETFMLSDPFPVLYLDGHKIHLGKNNHPNCVTLPNLWS